MIIFPRWCSHDPWIKRVECILLHVTFLRTRSMHRIRIYSNKSIATSLNSVQMVWNSTELIQISRAPMCDKSAHFTNDVQFKDVEELIILRYMKMNQCRTDGVHIHTRWHCYHSAILSTVFVFSCLFCSWLLYLNACSN